MSEFCGLLWQINRTWARGLLEPLIYTQLVRSTGVWSGRRGSLAELSPLPVGSNDRIRADPVRTELNWHLAAFSISVSCLSSTPCVWVWSSSETTSLMAQPCFLPPPLIHSRPTLPGCSGSHGVLGHPACLPRLPLVLIQHNLSSVLFQAWPSYPNHTRLLIALCFWSLFHCPSSHHLSFRALPQHLHFDPAWCKRTGISGSE